MNELKFDQALRSRIRRNLALRAWQPVWAWR